MVQNAHHLNIGLCLNDVSRRQRADSDKSNQSTNQYVPTQAIHDSYPIFVRDNEAQAREFIPRLPTSDLSWASSHSGGNRIYTLLLTHVAAWQLLWCEKTFVTASHPRLRGIYQHTDFDGACD